VGLVSEVVHGIHGGYICQAMRSANACGLEMLRTLVLRSRIGHMSNVYFHSTMESGKHIIHLELFLVYLNLVETEQTFLSSAFQATPSYCNVFQVEV